MEVEIELNSGNRDSCSQELHMNLAVIYMGQMDVCILIA